MIEKFVIAINFQVTGGNPSRYRSVNANDPDSLCDADIVLLNPVEARQTGNLLPSRITEFLGRGGVLIVLVTHLLTQWRQQFDVTFETGSGRFVGEGKDFQLVADYWNRFGAGAAYNGTLQGDFSKILLTTKGGEKVVAAVCERPQRGQIVFLPPPQLPPKQNQSTAEEFLNALSKLAETIAESQLEKFTPPPEWVLVDEFRLRLETELEAKKADLEKRIQDLRTEEEEVNRALQKAGWPRALLYEHDKPLERAVIKSLRLMGFKADDYDDGQSQFDIVFEDPEGNRFLGECEGKERRSIDIKKLRQLLENLEEDFERETVEDYAQGVLFGNPHRLQPLESRGEPFTKKCLVRARKRQIALIKTSDLFQITKYFLEQKSPDPEFQKKCRQVIMAGIGKTVVFPMPKCHTGG